MNVAATPPQVQSLQPVWRNPLVVEDVLAVEDLAVSGAYPEVILYKFAALDEPAVGELSDARPGRALRMATNLSGHTGENVG